MLFEDGIVPADLGTSPSAWSPCDAVLTIPAVAYVQLHLRFARRSSNFESRRDCKGLNLSRSNQVIYSPATRR